MNHPIRLALITGAAALLLSIPSPAAGTSTQKNDQEQEYIQVRKIALKDNRVQEAFQKANERLDDRILEIDPSLKSYMEKRNAPAQPARATAKASPSPAEKHTAPSKKSATHPTGSSTHTVAKGETLSSIAAEYKVSVASLKTANNITDDRKLRVGQKLVIPAATSKSAAAQPEKDQSLWTKLKNSLD